MPIPGFNVLGGSLELFRVTATRGPLDLNSETGSLPFPRAYLLYLDPGVIIYSGTTGVAPIDVASLPATSTVSLFISAGAEINGAGGKGGDGYVKGGSGTSANIFAGGGGGGAGSNSGPAFFFGGDGGQGASRVNKPGYPATEGDSGTQNAGGLGGTTDTPVVASNGAPYVQPSIGGDAISSGENVLIVANFGRIAGGGGGGGAGGLDDNDTGGAGGALGSAGLDGVGFYSAEPDQLGAAGGFAIRGNPNKIFLEASKTGAPWVYGSVGFF